MRAAAAALPAAVLLVQPTAALAHGSLPGTGGFAAGLLHPLLATEHAILLLSLGLLVGVARATGPAAWLTLGLAAGLVLVRVLPGPDPRILTAAALGLAAFAGALAALGDPARYPGPVLPTAAAAAGMVIGLGTDLPPVTDLAGAIAVAAGTVTCALLVALNAAAFARSRVGAGPGRRIAGSWITAAAVLMLAFSLQTAQAGP
jgi:hypothetical protein